MTVKPANIPADKQSYDWRGVHWLSEDLEIKETIIPAAPGMIPAQRSTGAEMISASEIPAEAAPAEEIPAEGMPAEEIPAAETPAGAARADGTVWMTGKAAEEAEEVRSYFRYCLAASRPSSYSENTVAPGFSDSWPCPHR